MTRDESPRIYEQVSSLTPLIRLSGGRTWWAHFEFTRMNIAPTILRKKIEDLDEAGALAATARGRDRMCPVEAAAVRCALFPAATA
jgi:hypothetical protein